MTTYDSFDAVDHLTRQAIVDLLFRLADDELLTGYRGSEWAGLTPIVEGESAFESITRAEISHARIYYALLCELGQGEVLSLMFSREPRQYRCSSLVTLPKGDWCFSVLRQFLHDVSENVRLAALSKSSLTPLARAAEKIYVDEKEHMAHSRTWVLRIGQSNDKNRQCLQDALYQLYPHALGLFEPTEADEVLAKDGISPSEEQCRREWESAVWPVLTHAGLEIDEAVQPIHGGRQPGPFTQLIRNMQDACKADTTAK